MPAISLLKFRHFYNKYFISTIVLNLHNVSNHVLFSLGWRRDADFALSLHKHQKRKLVHFSFKESIVYFSAETVVEMFQQDGILPMKKYEITFQGDN